MYKLTIVEQTEGQVEYEDEFETSVEASQALQSFAFGFGTVVADDLNTKEFRAFKIFGQYNSKPSFNAFIEQQS